MQDRTPGSTPRPGGGFVTSIFERYKRTTGNFEEAILEMYLSGLYAQDCRNHGRIEPGEKIGKDAVSCISESLQEQQRTWREQPLERAYPYLYLTMPT